MKILRLFRGYLFRMKNIIYDKFLVLAFTWIWLISMLDHYMTIKMQETILDYEQNPIGSFLINLDSGSVALFMTAKMMCLWIIASIIISIYYSSLHSTISSSALLCMGPHSKHKLIKVELADCLSWPDSYRMRYDKNHKAADWLTCRESL